MSLRCGQGRNDSEIDALVIHAEMTTNRIAWFALIFNFL